MYSMMYSATHSHLLFLLVHMPDPPDNPVSADVGWSINHGGLSGVGRRRLSINLRRCSPSAGGINQTSNHYTLAVPLAARAACHLPFMSTMHHYAICHKICHSCLLCTAMPFAARHLPLAVATYLLCAKCAGNGPTALC
jgi:hypothetical protein